MAKSGSIESGPLSNEVMEAVWKVDRPVSVREIADELNARRQEPLAYTTVMTVMNRLTERHTLERKRTGNRFLYEPTAPNAAGLAVKNVIRTYGEAAMAHFVEEAREDPAVMSRLRNLLAEK
jgi:predicted transcriptional regulator